MTAEVSASDDTSCAAARTMSVDMSAAAIEARLRVASRLAGSLRPEHRLATKIDLSGAAVAARLKEASDLFDLCRALAEARGAKARALTHVR
jgi:hypothetical protein